VSILAKEQKYPENAKKNNNLLKTKIILNIKMSAKGGPVFTFGLPGGGSPPAPRQLRHNRKMSTSYHKSGLVSSHQFVGGWLIFCVLW